MARSAAAVVAIAAIALMAALCAEGTTLGCVDLLTNLCPCSPYVAGRLNAPGPDCCDAVQAAKNSIIANALNKVACCTCINNVLPVVVGVNVTLINNIPKLCGIDANFSLSVFCPVI